MGRIVVVDYHKGNLLSVAQGLAAAGGTAFISDKPDDIAAADAVVLPGVGAFADAMDFMDVSGQTQAVKEALAAGKPFLGICLGAQLLFAEGNEGVSEDGAAFRPGLGAFEGRCVRIPDRGLKVPHVGWDQVCLADASARGCALLKNVPDGANFYFTHSYYVSQCDEQVVVGWTDYGVRMPSVVARDAVFGCQFHPEKSSGKGLVILGNFVDIVAGRMTL